MREAGVNPVKPSACPGPASSARPGTYDWSLLDEVLDLLHAHGIAVDLATATAAPPPWFTRQHPATPGRSPLRAPASPTAADRVFPSPSSPAYAEAATPSSGQHWRTGTATTPHPAVWHVQPRVGAIVKTPRATADTSADAFPLLAAGAIQEPGRPQRRLGHRLLEPALRRPGKRSTRPRDTNAAFRNPGQEPRPTTASARSPPLTRHRAETAILRRITPRVLITTNVMGTLEKKVDGYAFAPSAHLVSVDHYLPRRPRRTHRPGAQRKHPARAWPGASGPGADGAPTSAVN